MPRPRKNGGERVNGGGNGGPSTSLGDAFLQVTQGLARLEEILSLQEEETSRKIQEALRLQEAEAESRFQENLRLQKEEAGRKIHEALRLQEEEAAVRLQEILRQQEREVERQIQEALRRQEEETGRRIQEALRLHVQKIERWIQEALRQQEQRAERRLRETLLEQEDESEAALHEAVCRMEQKLKEKDDAILALRVRLQATQQRLTALEEGSSASEGPGWEAGCQRLEDRAEKAEPSLQRALQIYTPTNGVLRELEGNTLGGAALPSPSRTVSASRAGGVTEAGVGLEDIPSPKPGSSSTYAEVAGRSSNSKKEESCSEKVVAGGDEQAQRQQVKIRIRVAIERMRTSLPSPVGEALWRAVKQGNVEEIGRLLDSGADVNYIDQCGRSPLQSALFSEPREDVVKLLLERGADPNAVDDCGSSMLHRAATKDKSGWCVQLLIDAGGDVNARNVYGSTPLHYAVTYNSEAAVRALLAAGAKKNLRAWGGAWKGKTPFDDSSPSVMFI